MRSDDVFPPDTASRRRAHGLLRGLCEHCDVTFLYLQTPEHGIASRGPDFDVRRIAIVQPAQGGRALRSALEWLRGLASPLPAEARRFTMAAFREAQRRFVAEAAGEPVVIVCDGLEMSGNVERTLAAKRVLLEFEGDGACATLPVREAERRRADRHAAEVSGAFDLVFTVASESDAGAAVRLHAECAALAGP